MSRRLVKRWQVWAVARCWSLYTRSWCDLEVTETLFDRAFAANIPVLVGFDRDAYLIPEPVKIPGIEATHDTIHAVSRTNANCLGALVCPGGEVKFSNKGIAPKSSVNPSGWERV